MAARRSGSAAWSVHAALAAALVVTFPSPAQPAAAKPKVVAQKATLLLASDVACTVKLDGEKVAELVPDEPRKVAVEPGEHLVSASSADGLKWSKVIDVRGTGQTVVKVELAAAPNAAPRAPAQAVGTLLVFTDAAIELEIDGKAAGSLSGTPDAPGKRVFTLAPGKHFLKAVSQEAPEVNASADVQIRDGAQEIVRAMVADQVAERQAAARAAEAARLEVETAKSRMKEMDLRWVNIPAGEFRMGCSPGDKKYCYDNEKPAHTVRITKPFEMMATEVTAGQFRTWALGRGYAPPEQPGWSAPDVPVVNVTWADGQAFCAAFGGRLPTEAEWEYAARGGSEEARYGPLDAVAWYADNAGRARLDSTNHTVNSSAEWVSWLEANGNRAHPVASKQANAFGLYDMLGNVWEWTADWYDSKYYKEKVEVDPKGPSSGEFRVLRGGSWNS